MKICIYCSSSSKIDNQYFKETESLARGLVENNISTIYGGGAEGLMGKLADTIIENGGKIKGIIPRFMYELDWEHKKVTDLVVTETMHERKAMYLEDIDGVIALPGGTGTLEELLEVITLKRLGQFSKPILILNTNGFYDSLREMLEKFANQNFMNENDLNMWVFIDKSSDVIKYLKRALNVNSEAL